MGPRQTLRILPGLRRGLRLYLALSAMAIGVGAFAQTARRPADEANVLLFAVTANRLILSEAIPALQSGGHLLLPLGEFASVVTVAITTQPNKGTASGFMVNEAREFSLDVSKGTVSWDGRTEALDPRLVEVRDEDIYVASELLIRWLPIDLETDFSSLSIKVTAREPLPFQLRLERERRAEQISRTGAREDPGYERQATPYRIIDMPFIDQTISTNLTRSPGGSTRSNAYATYLTADLMGMESSIFLTNGGGREQQNVRYTLGRHDPDAALLGPLHARALGFGNIPVPSVDNVSRGNLLGTGASFSNRLLNQPTSFDRHSLQGDLPPGWDVELFYNDMLVATQQSRADGKYNFEDQPLMYGRNDFRLVFHGPLGQLRVERQNFELDQSLNRPGDFYYDYSQHKDLKGMTHSVAQFDVGVTQGLTAIGGVVSSPRAGLERRYTNLGLRGFWQSLIFSGYHVASQNGGSLRQGEIKTRIGDFGVDASHTQLNRFSSDYFSESQRTRQKLRVNGPMELPLLPRLPVTLELVRDSFDSGSSMLQGNASVSGNYAGTWITNRLEWTSSDGMKSASGMLLLGRRVADVGVNVQLGYSVSPVSKLTDVALLANSNLADGYTAIAAMSHSLASGANSYTASLNKGVGNFGFGVSATYSGRGNLSVGIQLFMSMAREPRTSAWSFDAASRAGTGAVSARAFVDKNMNGVMDEGEVPIKGAGFSVNGSGVLPARTDSSGVAMLSGLQAYEASDVALELETLEEPEWAPVRKGVRLVPRPGRVAEVEFPIAVASEIDGTVYLSDGPTKKGIGGVALELVDDNGNVVGTAKSSWDGYYILPGVYPGKYRLRVSPEQVRRQHLEDALERRISVGGDGEFIDGMDFVITREGSAPAKPAATEGAAADPGRGVSTKNLHSQAPLGPGAQEVEQVLRQWLAAWASRDVAAYLGAYSRRFSPADGGSRARWAAQRKAILGRVGALTVEADALDIGFNGPNRAVSTFRQRYCSQAFGDEVTKVLEWEKADGRWSILRETAKPVTGADGRCRRS